MKRGKKTIRLTESEMINLIETIVNEVKREKRNQISESRRLNRGRNQISESRRLNRRRY
jgi:hypothetical protein